MHLSISVSLALLIHSCTCVLVTKDDISFLSQSISPIVKESLNQVTTNLTTQYKKLQKSHLDKRSFSFIGSYVSKTLVNPSIKSFESMLNQSLQIGLDRHQRHLRQASRKRQILTNKQKFKIAKYHADLIANDIQDKVNEHAQSETDKWGSHHIGLFKKKAK